MSDLDVLYIIGSGRTGSTILGQLLNANDGVFFGGELVDFWVRGFDENRLCSCLRPAHDCQIWGPIIAALRRTRTPDDIAKMVRLRSQESPLARFWGSLPGGGRPPYSGKVLENYRALYRAIQDATDCRLTVDSSKFTHYAWALEAIDSVRLTLAHLVRDPRAVAHSWRRSKQIPDPANHLELPRFGAAASTLRWLARNLSASTLGARLEGRYSLLRYEDLVTQPDRELPRLARELGFRERGLNFAYDPGRPLPGNHAIWGNPTRFESGDVRLSLDDAWRREQSGFDAAVIRLLTGPWLARFGYT